MKYASLIVLILPAIVFGAQPNDFSGLVGILTDIISYVVVLIFALTFIVLIWGIAKAWILRADNPSEIEKGKKMVLIGIVVLVIMSGMWGILALLRSSLFF